MVRVAGEGVAVQDLRWIGGGGVGCLCAYGPEAVKVMALFNVRVQRERGRAFSFCVGVHSISDTHALGQGEMGCEMFCSRLDGSLYQAGECALGVCVGGNCCKGGGLVWE